MTVTINGETHEIDPSKGGPWTVLSLVEHLGHALVRVAVEHNGRVLRRAQLSEVAVKAGDRFEIVTLVGGG